MNTDYARRIVDQLEPDALVVDVGGGGSPFPRADVVIDMAPFSKRAALGRQELGIEERFTAETWVQLDVCDRQPWPFEDNHFDYAVCSHLLEDVRDPIWVCAELTRIAKAGYVEVPSRIVEQCRGIEHPLYAGYYHHRWLVTLEAGVLCFRFKPHHLHTERRAIVADVGVARTVNPVHAIVSHEWTERLEATEQIDFDEQAVLDELCRFAEAARRIPDLLVARRGSFKMQVRRWFYFQRLKRSG